MKRLDFRPSARADILDILEYVAVDNLAAADRLSERIHQAASRLIDFPESAPANPSLGQGVRSLVIGKYLLLYRVETDRIDIIRVLHGARDLSAILGD